MTIGLVHSKKLCPAHRRKNKLQNLVPLAPISHLAHPDPLQVSRLFRVKGVNKVGNHRDGGWAGWSVNRVNGWLGSKELVVWTKCYRILKMSCDQKGGNRWVLNNRGSSWSFNQTTMFTQWHPVDYKRVLCDKGGQVHTICKVIGSWGVIQPSVKIFVSMPRCELNNSDP